MTASHSGLASPGSEPAPSTSPPTSTNTKRSIPSAGAACSRLAAMRAGPVAGVHEHRLLAEEPGHPRLGEDRTVHGARSRACEQHAGRDLLAVDDLRGRTRAGLGVDRQPLPADAAHDGLRPESPAELGRRKRADDIAAAADAEHQRAGCGPHGVVERAVGRVQATAQATETAARARSPRARPPRCPPLRARTLRRRSRACPRTAGRGRSRPRTCSPRTRAELGRSRAAGSCRPAARARAAGGAASSAAA